VTQTLPLAVMSEFERDLESAVAVAVVSLALALGALAGARAVAGRWNV
jgi:ABC-type sulfate transport system permease component